MVEPDNEERFEEGEGRTKSVTAVLVEEGHPGLDQQECDHDGPEDRPLLLLHGFGARIDECAERELDGQDVTECQLREASDANHEKQLL